MKKAKENLDYPFYNELPVQIPVMKWLVVMVAIVLGFIALTTRIPFIPLKVNEYLAPILFTGIPLVAFIWASKGHANHLFRKITKNDVKWGVLFFIFNIIATPIVGLILVYVVKVNTVADAVVNVFAELDSLGKVLMFVKMGIQLVGEELLTILPFLFILQLCVVNFKLSRRAGIWIAFLVTAVIFGAIHLPTYHWNLVQALVGIGLVRLVLTGAYMKTKNIWASSIAHILNDYAITLFSLLTASSVAPFIMQYFIH